MQLIYGFNLAVTSVTFNISSSHAYTNSPDRRFLHEHFLISKDSPILHAL